MPNLAITRSVVDGTVFTQAQNETQCTDIETLLNTTKLDSTNLQSGAVITATLAAGSVDNSKLAVNAVGTANIIDANITAAKLAANSVTGAKLDATTVDNSSLQYTASQLSVKPGGITPTHLAASSLAIVVPTGAILPYVAAAAPSGFLVCDGSAVSRATYSALFALIGITQGQGDGATTFNIPDLRGYFLRGYDNAAGNDPDAAARTASGAGGSTGDNIGTRQTSANLAHLHAIGPSSYLAHAPGDGSTGATIAAGDGVTVVGTISTATASTGGTESRPKNISVQYIIKT